MIEVEEKKQLKLHRVQRLAYKDPKPQVALIGGKGSGKTVGGAAICVRNAMGNPGCITVGVEPTATMVEEIMVPTLEWVLEHFGIPYKAYRSKNNMKLILPNQHRFIFRSGDKPERIEGFTASHGWIDEAGLVKDDAYRRTLGRLRDKQAHKIQLIVTGSPEPNPGWLWDQYGGEEGKFYYRASTKENEHNLHPQYFAFLDELPPDLQEMYKEGFFVPINKPRVYTEFNKTKHVSKGQIEKNQRAWIWLDFNINPGMHFCLAQEFGRNRDRGLHVLKDWFLPRASTIEVADTIKQFTAEHDLCDLPTIICDAAGTAKHSNTGWSDVDILEDAGFRVVWKRVRTQSDKHNPVKKEFHNGRLLIDPKCKHVIESMLHYGFREGSNIVKDDKYKHMADCVGYGVAYLRPFDHMNVRKV